MTSRKSYQNELNDGLIHETSLLNDNNVSIINKENEERIVFFDISSSSDSCESLIKLMNDRFAKVSLFLTENIELYEGAENSLAASSSRINSSIKQLSISHENNGFFSPGEINIVLRINSHNKNQKNRIEECLTVREQEILALLSKGLLYKEIAKTMGISLQTVKSHLKHIYPKLKVTNRTEAILKYLDLK